MFRLVAGSSQYTPSSLRNRDRIIHVGRLPVAIRLQFAQHVPVANHFQVVDRNKGTKPGSKLYFVFTRREYELFSDCLAAETKPQKGTIGCTGASLLERVKPRCRAIRNLWNACVDASQANRPTERSVV